MRTFRVKERIASRLERQGANAEPLLTIEEQLDGVKLELMRPVEVDGKEVSEIEIQAPNPDAILDARLGEAQSKDDIYKSFSKATGLSEDAIASLHGRDFDRLEKLYWGFIE